LGNTADLRRQIETGELAPGDAMPSITRLMQDHAVAWLTTRKSVRVLASGGLAEVVQGAVPTSPSA
jgi:DNA-binding GntR family transcriptional regulator